MSAPFYPPSMPAGSHEMRDYYSNQDPPRSSPHTAPSITPYLGLRARLSQIWLNRWTILILLVLVRTLLAIGSINTDLASARREALSACSDVESMGSTMASMPHYMSTGVNELAATGVEKSVNGLMGMTTLSVTAVEEIAVFVIGMMTNTYLCLITFAVTGSLHAVIGVIESAQDDINKLAGTVGGEIGDTLKTFSDAYNKVVDALSGVSALGISSPAPKAPDLTKQINEIKNFKLPADLDADLQKLNNSIPTFDQVKNLTDTAMREPFELVKGLIKENMGNFTFNRSLLAVPEKQKLTFCSDDDGINDFFDKLVGLAHLAKKIFIGVLVVAAILAMIPMAYREVRRWRHQLERASLINSESIDPMDTVYLVSRPYTSSFGLKVARIPPNPDSINSASRKQRMLRWAVAYATTEAALFVLCLAIAGLFSCLCQYILLKSVQSKTPELTNQVGGFADKVVAQLTNASEQWAIGTNDAINTVNRDINQNMLGWVNITTGAINSTLNIFVNETMNVLNKTFGGTPLFDPVKEVLNCLVLLKVQGVEKALTFVSDHAHVDFPQLPNDTFSVGALKSLDDGSGSSADQSFLASPGDDASDKITAAVRRFIDAFESGIRIEALISTVILLIWIFVVLMGIVYAIFQTMGPDKNRGDGGAVLQRNSVDPTAIGVARSNDFRSDNQDRFADIPLGNVRHTKDYGPAPEYTEREVKVADPFDGGETTYQDRKLGLRETENARARQHRVESTMEKNGFL